jgi:predicted N-formylglutamate amidohydrolase
MIKKIALILSCEHAVDTVPEPYQSLFVPFTELLATHRGIDFGALTIAEHLKAVISCDLVQANATRLLIDCNRSIHNSQCFSEVTQNLSTDEKTQLINRYYLPFRAQVSTLINDYIAQGLQVWHLSIHSFTPVMHDITRNADIGFLYDPRRLLEKILAKQWQMAIQKEAPEYRIRMNYPYKGISDGFTTTLRKQYTPQEYVGIEVESNQALTKNAQSLNTLKHILSKTLVKIQQFPP